MGSYHVSKKSDLHKLFAKSHQNKNDIQKNSMLMWDSKSQALEYQSLKVARGIGAAAMEDVLRLNRESMKFKYHERSQLYKGLESDDKSIPDK